MQRDVLEGHQHHPDVLSVVKLGWMGQLGVLDEKGMAPVAHDGRVRKHFANHPCPHSGVAGFLAQFALAADDRVGFIRIEHAPGDLEFDGV